jgi:ribose-phosphate pyrophosphokinase
LANPFAFVLPDLKPFGIKEKTLGERVWEELSSMTPDFDLVEADFTKFGDTSFKPDLLERVRNKQVYIFISPYMTASEQFALTPIILDACRRANANRNGINLIETYNPWYAQDKRDPGHRESNSGRVFAQCCNAAGLSHLFYFEPHSLPALEGWYDSVDPIYMSAFHATHIKQDFELGNAVAAAPDDTINRVKYLADALNIPLTTIGKVRKHKEVEKARAMPVREDLSGKTVLLYDDMIRSGETVAGAAESAKNAGAGRVIVIATDLLLYEPEKVFNCEYIDEVRGTQTYPKYPENPKLKVYDIAEFAAKIIYRKTHDMDVSGFIADPKITPKLI